MSTCNKCNNVRGLIRTYSSIKDGNSEIVICEIVNGLQPLTIFAKGSSLIH